jgi:DNA repair protein RadC
MLSFLLVRRGNDVLPALVGLDGAGLLRAIDFTVGDAWLVGEGTAGAVNADPAAVYFGARIRVNEQMVRRAAEYARVRPLRPRGQLFALPPGFMTGYAEVRSTLEKHRAETPTLDTIRHSAVFAGITIRTSIEVAERAYQCIVDLYHRHGDEFAPIEDARDCIRQLGFPKTREPQYREIQEWAFEVQRAIASGLRDRELRRHLILHSNVPTLLSIAKVSFILSLLGQDCVCLDARLLARSKIKEDWRGKTELALQRYERAEDAFLSGNPNYDPADPIGRARAQWISWEVSPVRGAPKPASHSVWLNVVRSGAPAKLRVMEAHDYAQDDVLQWKERADGHWSASAHGLHYDVAPDRKGHFHTWVKIDGDWKHLGRFPTLGGAFGAARRYSDQATKAADAAAVPDGDLQWSRSGNHCHAVGRKGKFSIKATAGHHPYLLSLDGHAIDTYDDEAQAKKVANHLNALHEAPAASEKVPVIYESEIRELHWKQEGRRWFADGKRGSYEVAPGSGGAGWNSIYYGAHRQQIGHFMTAKSAKAAANAFDSSGGEMPAAKEGLEVVERDVKAVREGRKKGQIKTPKDVYNLLHPTLVKQSVETFIVVPLDIHGRPLSPTGVEVARGQTDAVHVDPAQVLAPVVSMNAKGFVCAHNHPSGAGKASPADVDLTRKINEAAKALDRMCLDHCVIGDGSYESIREAYGKKAGF